MQTWGGNIYAVRVRLPSDESRRKTWIYLHESNSRPSWLFAIPKVGTNRFEPESYDPVSQREDVVERTTPLAGAVACEKRRRLIAWLIDVVNVRTNDSTFNSKLKALMYYKMYFFVIVIRLMLMFFTKIFQTMHDWSFKKSKLKRRILHILC